VLAKSFARIHKDNLINFGIIPLTVPKEIYDSIAQDAEIEFPAIAKEVSDASAITFRDLKTGKTYSSEHGLTERQRKIILAGGMLNYVSRK